MWLNHHSIFTLLERVDRPVVYLNHLLLLTVVFVPYPTGILGEALRTGHGARTAAVAYSATMALNAYSWAALWLYASTGRRLLSPAFPEERRGISTLAFILGTFLYTLSVGVAVVSAYVCLAFHALLAAYYALDPLSRRANAAGSPRDPRRRIRGRERTASS